MNKLLMLVMLFTSLSAYSQHMIILEFDNIKDHQKWIEWYLDQGGEEASGFLVQNWDWYTMELVKDPDYSSFNPGVCNE